MNRSGAGNRPRAREGFIATILVNNFGQVDTLVENGDIVLYEDVQRCVFVGETLNQKGPKKVFEFCILQVDPAGSWCWLGRRNNWFCGILVLRAKVMIAPFSIDLLFPPAQEQSTSSCPFGQQIQFPVLESLCKVL